MDVSNQHRAPGLADLAAGGAFLVAALIARARDDGSVGPGVVLLLGALTAAFVLRGLTLLLVDLWHDHS